MAVQDYKINYKSDFVLTINGDAGWAIPFCIKFWTGMPSQAYFVGFDGVKYVNCRVGDTPTQLLVMFDDHHLPIGPLKMQIAYHTTIEEFPGSVFDEVTNARDVIVTIDGTDYQVMLDFTGEDAPELEFNLPAYANEAERIQNELQRQQNEADRIAAELQREQATAAAVQGAENVNAQLNGTTLTVTNRNGVSTSVNTKGEQGEQGPVGPQGPQGEQGETGISIVSFTPKSETSTTLIYTVTFSDDTTQDISVPKGPQGDTGLTGNGIASTTLNSDYTLTIAYTDGTTYTTPSIRGAQGVQGVSIIAFTQTGETATNTLYNVVFSDGRTQSVAIPKGVKGDKGDTGNPGSQGAQGPKGDTVTATDYTLYNAQGGSSEGAMSQDATTKAISAQTGYYTCGTAAGTPEKVVTVESGNLYKRTLGGHFKVKMTNKNTAASGVTLKIGSETAAALLYNGEAVSASNTWEANEVISVYFDGTNYQASNAQGGGGKIKVKGTASDVDFDIADENGSTLVRFQNGEIRTKRFNSATDGQISVNDSVNDLEVADSAGNILMRLRNGHIMTKEFDSSKLGDEFNYYATEFEDAEQALYDKVRNDIDDKTVVLLLTTDAHITTEEQYTLKYAKAFRKMAENIGADAIVSLGDIINEKVGSGWDITANRDRIELYMKDTRNTYIPFLYALAHHEMYSSGYPTFLYGYPAVNVLGKMGKYQRNMIPVFDQNNYANFYVDVKPQGLRMIFLDSANVAGHPAGYTQATVDWLTSILSSTTSKIALFTHVPSKNGYSYNPNNSISRVVNDDLVRTALNNYVQGGGEVLGHYCGHAHCDNYGKESDMEYYIIQTACSVPRVDGGVPVSERPTLGTPIYYSDRAVGTLNEWCVDVACIHCDIDEVHMFRFGVGNDRVIQL